MTALANASCHLVGFSIRVPEEQVANFWDNERRQIHLLNPEVRHPLSIDDAVWPLPEDVDKFLAQSGHANFGEVDANPLNLMLAIPARWLSEGLPKTATSRYRLIAATVSEVDYRALNKIYNVIVDPSAEKVVDEVTTRWQDLGYDVMDQTAISGLTNCGIADAITVDRRESLAEGLNEYGLVKEVATAREIANMLNELAPEHKPFLPVRLWRAPG